MIAIIFQYNSASCVIMTLLSLWYTSVHTVPYMKSIIGWSASGCDSLNIKTSYHCILWNNCKPWCVQCCWKALKFDMWLDSTAVEAPVKFQSNIILTYNLTSFEVLWDHGKTSYRLVNQGWRPVIGWNQSWLWWAWLPAIGGKQGTILCSPFMAAHVYHIVSGDAWAWWDEGINKRDQIR